MQKFVFTSLRRDAGKTGVMVGLAQVLNKKLGYMKPFGDRLLYRKKRLWDFDSAIFTNLFGIDEQVEDMSIGFDHSKLRYMYDSNSISEKLLEMVEHNGHNKELLFIESGLNINFGMSVHLDAISIAKSVGAGLIIVTSGNDDKVVDDLTFFKRNVDLSGADLAGVVINKLKDVAEFKAVHGSYLDSLEMNVIGMIPFREELTRPTVKFIADVLFGKVLSGEKSLNRMIREIFVGAMSADAVLRMDQLKKRDIVIITSGDRSDMILAAINSKCIGIILSNNILPPPNIIARAAENDIPLILAQGDTYKVAQKIEKSVPLLSHTDQDKIAIWKDLTEKYVDISRLGF